VSLYVRLRVASEEYAMPVEHVLRVAHLGAVTAIPGSPPEILGVQNLNGQILPVVDLALLLGMANPARPTRLLVAEATGRQAGFAVTEVSEVGELPDPTEETESGLLAGATLAGGNLIGVIDLPQVFDSLERTSL
jgi:purine-binding chemotaxis protein CheW